MVKFSERVNQITYCEMLNLFKYLKTVHIIFFFKKDFAKATTTEPYQNDRTRHCIRTSPRKRQHRQKYKTCQFEYDILKVSGKMKYETTDHKREDVLTSLGAPRVPEKYISYHQILCIRNVLPVQ